MFEYKSMIKEISVKLFSVSIKDSEMAALDKIINQQASEGWELAAHSFIGGDNSIKSAVLLTFKREKD